MFPAVEDVVVAVPDGGGVDAGGVGACVRLRQAEAADHAVVEHLGDELHLLLLGAELLNESGEAVGQQGISGAVSEAGLGQLLNDDHLADGVVAGAAVLFTVVDPQKAHLGHFLPGVVEELVRFIQLRGLRFAVLRGELRGHFAEELLLFRQIEIHCIILSLRSSCGGQSTTIR